MKKEKNTARLNGKDLLNVGIFTAVYFVLNLLVAAVLGLIPAISMLVPFVSSFILGIPMMLYFMKIKKFGMVLITYIVYGVLLALAGVGIYTLVLGIIFALIAELSHLQGCHKEKPPEMDGFNYFRYSPRPEGGSLGYSSSSKLSNGPLRPERWSLVYSTFSSTPLSISFLACAEGSAE